MIGKAYASTFQYEIAIKKVAEFQNNLIKKAWKAGNFLALLDGHTFNSTF